jgi:predicted N-acyltransferase
VTEYSVEVARRIDQIDPEEWDALCAGRSFVNHRWQRLREAVYARYDPYYLQLRRRGRLEGAVICVIARRFAFPDAVTNPLLRAICRRLVADSRPLKCGAFDSCQPALLTRPGWEEGRLSAQLLKAVRHLAEQKRSPAVSVVKLSPRDRAWPALRAAGYQAVTLPPNTCLEISWPTAAAYEASLPSRRRRELRRYRRRAQGAGVTLEALRLSSETEPTLRQLIGNVFQRHRAPDPFVPDFLSRASAVLGSDFGLLAARQGQHLIGCITLVRCSNELTVEWLGLDYNRTPNTHTYHCLLSESVSRAIEMGVRRIWLGDTVYELKRDLGATLENRYAAVVTQNGLLNRFLKSGLRLAGLPVAPPSALSPLHLAAVRK